jgi:hypothetical protein
MTISSRLPIFRSAKLCTDEKELGDVECLLQPFLFMVTNPPFFCQLTEKEAIKLDLEDLPVYQENLDALVSGCLEDFPEDAIQDNISLYAACIAQANITQGTRDSHIR